MIVGRYTQKGQIITCHYDPDAIGEKKKLSDHASMILDLDIL